MKFSRFDYVVVAYILIHLVYGVYMFTQSISYGAIWLAFAIVEVGIFYASLNKFRILSTILAIILILQSLLSLGIVLGGNDSNTEEAASVLVLGYQLKNNEMSETLKLRLDKAYEYAMNNANSKLIVCGGITRENTVSEAEKMKEYLLSMGIREDRIICEDQSLNTIENIRNSLSYIDRDSKIVVLSSNYHVIRAQMICESVGLEVKKLGSKAPLLLIPNQCFFEKISILRLLLNI